MLRKSGISVHIFEISKRIAKTRREDRFFGAATSLPGNIIRLARLLRDLQIDMVHTNTVKAHMIGVPAARLSGIPVLMHVRDILEHQGRQIVRFYGKRLATQLVCVSEAVARWYQFSERSVVYNPIDVSRYDGAPTRVQAREMLNLPADLPLVGMVGRINRWKGHDQFLQILDAARAHADIGGVIVGEARFRDDDFVPELHRKIEHLGLKDRVFFVPWLSDPQVAYRALDLHCSCSTREPFGRTIIEAAACGTPTISFDDGAAAEIISHGVDGYLVPAGETAAFARTILSALSNDGTERMSVAARCMSRRFGVDQHRAAMVDLFRSMEKH